MVSEQLHTEVSEYLDQVRVQVEKALDKDVYTSYQHLLPDRILLRFGVGEALFSIDYSPSCSPKFLTDSILNNY